MVERGLDGWRARLIVDERRDEAHGYRHAYIHCRYNRVVGVAAYGRAALRWRRTIGRQRRLRMRYSMASPSSATQGRCNSVALQGWTRGDGGGTAPYSLASTSAREDRLLRA